MTQTGIQEAASVERDRDLFQAQLDIFLDPDDPAVIEPAPRSTGIPDNWIEAARNSPVYKMADGVEGRPSRCTRNTAACRWSGTCRRCRPIHVRGQRRP